MTLPALTADAQVTRGVSGAPERLDGLFGVAALHGFAHRGLDAVEERRGAVAQERVEVVDPQVRRIDEVHLEDRIDFARAELSVDGARVA